MCDLQIFSPTLCVVFSFLNSVLFVVQSLSHVQLLVTPRTAVHQASLSFAISQSLLKLLPTESVMPSNHLIHYCPLSVLNFDKVLFMGFFFFFGCCCLSF